MNENPELDRAWLDWYNILQKKVVPLMEAGDREAAISELDAFLSREKSPELRSDALGFKAQLREQLGELNQAKEELLQARLLVGPTYGRYVDELGLGDICIKQQLLDEAILWYRTALHTCLEGEGISGGSALKALVTLRPAEKLSPEDRALYAQVAQRSWHVLGLPGQPDPTDLAGTVSAIKEGEANPPRMPRVR